MKRVAASEEPPVQRIIDNRYRLKKTLGSGGMADVYLAHDEVLDRDVALKVLSRRYANDEEFVKRFKKEAQSAAVLSHPNIVPVYDRGELEGGTHYITMEYVPGGTLKDRIRKEGPLPPREAVGLALKVARAIQAAHQSGLIHRDVKPQNILLTDSGDAKVADFGIARAVNATTTTSQNLILGTAQYMSPEQARGEPVSQKSDLYSLGVVMYEMLTGELPYHPGNPVMVPAEAANGRLRTPREVDPTIPEGINAVTLRLLDKDSAKRYSEAGELIDDLERVSAGLPPASATTQILERVGADLPPSTQDQTKPTQRYTAPPAAPAVPAGGRGQQNGKRLQGGMFPWFLAALIVATLALVGFFAWNIGQREQEEEPEEPATTQVPDLTGLDLVQAENALAEAGLNVGGQSEVPSNEVPQGGIVEQNPSAGTEVVSASSVDVTVSSGPEQISGPVPGTSKVVEEPKAADSVEGQDKGAGKGKGKGKGKGGDD